MSFDTVVTTVGLLGIASILFALAFLVYELDRLSRRPTPTPIAICQYSRRTTIMVGTVLNRNTIRIDGQTWDLTQTLDPSIRRGQRIALVLER